MNKWTKQNGIWAVTGPDVQSFARVTVTKASGETSEVDLNTAIRLRPTDKYLTAVPRESSGGGKDSRGRNRCSECGEPGALVEDLEDGLMKHYGCCDIPPTSKYR